MTPLLYSELTPWYWLLDPLADHADEAACYQDVLARACPNAQSLLELGAGAGNKAHYLKSRGHCTLTDVSEPMLALSRQQHPECEHAQGDMRTLRLGRDFEAVFVHDAMRRCRGRARARLGRVTTRRCRRCFRKVANGPSS